VGPLISQVLEMLSSSGATFQSSFKGAQ